jgi:hypothetical protein
MPSQLHESHLLLFRNQPALAAELIRGVLGAELPSFREARVVSADLTDMKPTEYRADMVIELSDVKGPVHAIIVEVQLSAVERKRFVWPAYVATLRARLECPVSLLVVTADDAVARWAAKPMSMGGLHQFTPYVLGPSGVPEVTDDARACANPELAVLSTLAHGRDANFVRAIEIALAARNAIANLDADRASVYVDLITNALGEAARQALKNTDMWKYEYQTEFARYHYARGEAAGYVAVIARHLAARFGGSATEIAARIAGPPVAALEAIIDRQLTAGTLEEAVGLAMKLERSPVTPAPSQY